MDPKPILLKTFVTLDKLPQLDIGVTPVGFLTYRWI